MKVFYTGHDIQVKDSQTMHLIESPVSACAQLRPRSSLNVALIMQCLLGTVAAFNCIIPGSIVNTRSVCIVLLYRIFNLEITLVVLIARVGAMFLLTELFTFILVVRDCFVTLSPHILCNGLLLDMEVGFLLLRCNAFK